MHPSLSQSLHQAQASRPTIATLYPLNMLSVFEVKGLDTLAFLQGQLTNDIVAPGIEQSRLAGYCTAQGRLLATMVLGEFPSEDGIPLVRGLIRQDILAPVLKRLSMFVLRAKVSLALSTLHIVGVSVQAASRESLTSALNHALPDTPWQTFHTPTGTWIAAPNPAATLQRWWWIAGAAHQSAIEAVGAIWGHGHASDWEVMDIQTGLPWIEARTQDLFIPQTLNLDLIGGVSFTKGCYPGQEIVARSHYRGTVKKRMALGKLQISDDQSLIPSADIFDGHHAEQPCGRLINVAKATTADQKTQWLLFECSFEAYDHQQLKAIAANGLGIETVALPYTTRPNTQ